jgi:hypothetical protein
MEESKQQAHPEAGQWPRDFDIRAEYAEQQELLNSRFDSTPDNNNPGGQNQ